MTPIDWLDQARKIFAQRGAEYGNVYDMHDQIAQIASLVLGRPFTAHDIAMLMVCVKLARLSHEPAHRDSYVDAINYMAFAGSFALTEKEPGDVYPST